ncbi:hypothetical protein Tco_0149283 [Tanacetum coccineum]
MAQPDLYDGNEILKLDHVPIIIPTSEADRELVDMSIEKINEKLKDPESVKANIFVLNQLFADFDKTCKKRITPTGITEGERGFEQTKRCYLTKLSIAYNVAMTRAVELEAKNLNLHKKIQNDDHDNMVTHLSRLEVDNLNLQLNYQHLKDRIETSKSRTSKDAPEFDAFFELNEKDAQLQTHRNTIRKLKAQISQLKANKSDVTGILLPQRLKS